MKKIIYLLVFVVCILNCNEDKGSTDPADSISSSKSSEKESKQILENNLDQESASSLQNSTKKNINPYKGTKGINYKIECGIITPLNKYEQKLSFSGKDISLYIKDINKKLYKNDKLKAYYIKYWLNKNSYSTFYYYRKQIGEDFLQNTFQNKNNKIPNYYKIEFREEQVQNTKNIAKDISFSMESGYNLILDSKFTVNLFIDQVLDHIKNNYKKKYVIELYLKGQNFTKKITYKTEKKDLKIFLYEKLKLNIENIILTDVDNNKNSISKQKEYNHTYRFKFEILSKDNKRYIYNSNIFFDISRLENFLKNKINYIIENRVNGYDNIILSHSTVSLTYDKDKNIGHISVMYFLETKERLFKRLTQNLAEIKNFRK